MMSLGRLWRYYGAAHAVGLRDGLILLAMFLLPLAPFGASAQTVPDSRASWAGESGVASYYGSQHQGRRTASGARFDQRMLTAAHRWLPFGTKVRVTVLGTGKAVIVTITDRLYSKRRVIDLSTAAAAMLGMLNAGIAKVSLSPG